MRYGLHYADGLWCLVDLETGEVEDEFADEIAARETCDEQNAA